MMMAMNNINIIIRMDLTKMKGGRGYACVNVHGMGKPSGGVYDTPELKRTILRY